MADKRGSMSTVASIAQSGLQAAQLRLSSSAHNVANGQTEGFRRQSVAQQAIEPQGGVQAQINQAHTPGVALEQEALEQIAASYAFKANMLVLRTQDQMAGTLLDTRA